MSDIEKDVCESQAYYDGRSAFGVGEDLTMGNPFAFLSNDYHDWQRGWCDAQEEAL